MALLGLLAVPSARLEAQCTLPGGPASLVSFEPNPPGVPRGTTPYLSAGFSSNLALYQNGGSGPYRLLMQESFGYSVLDLSDPVNPTALAYHDVRFPIGGPNSVGQAGDGQSFVQTIAVAPDGQRMALSTNGPTKLDTVVGRPAGDAFTLWGDFGNGGANGTLIQHIGARYIAYDIQPNGATASDATTLPSGSLSKKNMASESTGWSGGFLASIAGNYIVYQSSGGVIRVVDASAPGPIGSITAGYPQTTITSADFNGRSIAYYSAAVDPADPTKLWVLAELNAQAGENSPSYGLLYLTSNLSKFSGGPIWRVPSQPGDTWVTDPGASSALIPGNGGLFVFTWAQRSAPSPFYKLYSTTTAGWGSVAPGAIDIPTTVTPGHPMRGFGAATGNSFYAYLPTGPTAWVIPMSCVSVNAPAVASMSVVDQAGAPLNNNDTVFIGDQITITTAVNPAPVSQPLTGFGWNFDFDFHAGTAVEDNGAGFSPRIKNVDNDQFGNPSTPPAQVTLVGPCDPRNGGNPNSGAGCWNSVRTNAAVGGPDFTGTETPASPAKPLTFAFEANNILGSAGASLFTLKWKVPKAQLQSTQVLSAQPLVSSTEGHPTATGFKWYFGDNPAALALVPPATCSGPTCVPTFDTKGTHSYWLTASYANGFTTPDYAGAAMGTYTVTDFAPAFKVNGATSGPITVVTNQNLTVLNSSQRGNGIVGAYQYSFCPSPPCADNYAVWSMADPPTNTSTSSAPIPIPGAAGAYALKIKVNYSGGGGGTAFWPDPAGVTYFPVNVVDVQPLDVNVTVSPTSAPVGQTVTFSCSVSGGLAPYSYQWRSPFSFAIPGATQQTWQTTSSSAGNVAAYCFVTDSQPIQATSSAGATATFTGSAPPPASISVSVSANPNPTTVNTTVTFTCNASGGNGPYTYQWRSPASSPFVAGTSQSFQTSSPTPGTISAGCTATDTTGVYGSGSRAVTVADVVAPPAACADVNYRIQDDATGLAIPLSGNFLGQFFSVQTGQVIRFVASGSTQANWGTVSWTFGDGGTGDGLYPVHTFMAAGISVATVTIDGNSACKKSYTFNVSGPSGLFTARYADDSLFSSTNVESGKDMSFVATDIADSYAWNFGDGFTATGKSPTHAFTVHGSSSVTFTTTLTVTIGSLQWVTTQTFTVVPPPEPPKWFVAGLAYTQGAASGTVWQSDMTIFNPHPTLSGTYSLAFLDGKNPVDPSALDWKTINLGALQSASAQNVLGSFFGKPLGSYGAVIVRGDVAPVAPSITSRTYNNGDAGRGTFGLSVPVAQASGGVSPQSSTAQQLLVGLRDDASADTNTGAYTNIGLVNLIAYDWSHAHLTFLDAAGENLGTLNVDVPPYGVAQLSRPLTGGAFLNSPPMALYRVRVTVDPGGAVYPYATVIDQASTDPIVVTPTEQPSNAYRVPGIVRLAGANNTVWRSRVTLTNPSGNGSRKVHMVFSYVSCGANGCGNRVSITGDIMMNPGQTQTWDDFVKVWLTVKGDIPVDDAKSYQDSFLDVSPGDSNSDPLLVLGQTYNAQPTGPVGLQLSGFTDLDGGSKAGAGQRLLLTGLASNADFRTNVAFFLTSGTSGHFNFRVLSDTGVTLKTFGWDLTDSSPFKQFGDGELFGGVNKSDRMSIVVDSFDGSPVAGYATIIDNTSGDATFVKAQPAP